MLYNIICKINHRINNYYYYSKYYNYASNKSDVNCVSKLVRSHDVCGWDCLHKFYVIVL